MKKTLALFIVFAVLPFISTVHAVEGGPPLWVDFTQTISNEADFDDFDGAMSVTSSKLKLRTGLYQSDRAKMGMDIKYQYADYDFDNDFPLSLQGDDPFEDAHQISLDLLHLYQWTDQWSSYVMLGTSAAFESGADFSDSLGYQLVASGLYEVNETLTLGFGLVALYDLTDDLSVLPLIVVDWQVNDRLRLELRDEARLSYVMSPDHNLTGYLRGGMLEGLGPRKFRLDDDGLFDGGSMEFDGFSFGLGLAWQPTEMVSIIGQVDTARNCEVTLRDDDGSKIFEDDLESVVAVGVSVSLDF